MRNIARCVALVVIITLPAFAQSQATPPDRDVVFQASTIGALLDGVYDGDITLGELRRHGDFGIGTVNGLDGELIVCPLL